MNRLFITADLNAGASFPLDAQQSHYLKHVMRQKAGDTVLVFNGRDGEWQAEILPSKKNMLLATTKQTREQKNEKPLSLIFAPIKRGHGDMTIEKASELGVTALYPIITERTVISRVPLDRYAAIAREAAEQCERLSVPELHEAQKLESFIQNWNPQQHILWCAEQGAAQTLANVLQNTAAESYAIMIGPEGGFSDGEFARLRALPFITPVSLGPRILRADTAAISALSLIQGLRA